MRHAQSDLVAPRGTNWGYLQDKELDGLLAKARTTFEPAAQNRALPQVHEKFVNDAVFLYITHDVNPHAMSPRVRGFVQAQNWFQDFSPVFMAPK